MKHIDHYDLIPSYTMKCRLYPNSECAKKIDDAIYALRVYHNCLLYDMYNNYFATREVPYKPKKADKEQQKPVQGIEESDKEFEERLYAYEQKKKYKEGDIIHFAHLDDAFTAEYKNRLINEHPIINAAPQSAITTNVGLKSDVKRSFGKLPVEFQKPHYYSDKHKRESYCYQEVFGKISTGENDNVFYINLAKVGTCKVRGWNKNIRFGSDHSETFLDYALNHKNEKVTIKIKKDNCGDYWICFTLSDVYKPIECNSNRVTGVDVGVADIAILSDGTKYENKRFKNKAESHLAYLMTKQSKQQGWKNQKFVEAHRKDKDLQVSKGYVKTGLKIAKLNRQIARRRSDYNHNITTDIIKKYHLIGIESLDVKGLLEKNEEEKTNAQNACTHDNLADAAMGEVLSMLKYKAEWHKKKIVAVNKYYASSKICHHCGYKMPAMPTDVRKWQCPDCGEINDRDINAANNIELQALIDTYGEELGRKYHELGFVTNVT